MKWNALKAIHLDKFHFWHSPSNVIFEKKGISEDAKVIYCKLTLFKCYY